MVSHKHTVALTVCVEHFLYKDDDYMGLKVPQQ
jgi:hypothetical protein